jgi:hypothetical protein
MRNMTLEKRFGRSNMLVVEKYFVSLFIDKRATMYNVYGSFGGKLLLSRRATVASASEP